MAKKKGRGWHGDSKGHSIAAKKGSSKGKKKNTAKARAGTAFKKTYKEMRASGSSKAWSRRQGHKAAMRASRTAGTKMAATWAKSRANIGFGGIRIKMSKTAKKQFARGYTKALRKEYQ